MYRTKLSCMHAKSLHRTCVPRFVRDSTQRACQRRVRIFVRWPKLFSSSRCRFAESFAARRTKLVHRGVGPWSTCGKRAAHMQFVVLPRCLQRIQHLACATVHVDEGYVGAQTRREKGYVEEESLSVELART